MNEFASLIHPRDGAVRYSTYISSSLGRCVKSEFSTRSSLAEINEQSAKEENAKNPLDDNAQNIENTDNGNRDE